MASVRHMSERLVLVHGSVVGGRGTWSVQRRDPTLADRFELLVLERPGFSPNPPVERVDFEEDAELIADLLHSGDHVVGHSYGGVITLLAAARRPDAIRSLTVIEPPATSVARGNPVVDRFAADAIDWWENGPIDDPPAFLRGFLDAVGSDFQAPSPLPPELEQGVRTLIAERGPWEAEIPLVGLSAAPFPKLVVSGAHHAAFDTICDVLEQELRAKRLVFSGYGHSPHRHPDFDAALIEFVDGARAARG
jgi:pimeloyl-ACP methyl ester carboxylesterase